MDNPSLRQRQPSVVSLVIERDGAVLLGRRSLAKDHAPGRWEAISGRVEPGETLHQAARREAMEETGLAVEIVRQLDTFTFRRAQDNEDTLGVTFHCRVKDGQEKLSAEHHEFVWVPLDGLPAFGLPEGLVRCIRTVLQEVTMDLRIDAGRLWQSLMDLARIGATPLGGVRRITLTDLDRLGRDRVVEWFKAAGLAVRVDPIGNIFGRRAGRDPSRPPVVTGSHIDTQPSGGKFDGAYGVLAGLEVVRTLNDHAVQTEAPIEVAAWTNEEGSRYTPVMMGSGVFAGVFPLQHALAQTDVEGKSAGDELERIGYSGTAPLGTPVGAYFEAHIEQGPILEETRNTIGIVTGALGQRWFDVTVTGMNAHAGPTPMPLRKDALLAASRLVGEVNRIALGEAPHGRGTVGFMQVAPNSRNVVPGEVKFSVDFRHPDDAGLKAMKSKLSEACAQVEGECSVKIRIEEVVYFPPCRFDAACVDAVRAGARAGGYSSLEIVSGAAHDAVYVARVAPAAMIFIPCKDGISHNELEDAKPDDLAAGCNVLLHAMLSRAGIP